MTTIMMTHKKAIAVTYFENRVALGSRLTVVDSLAVCVNASQLDPTPTVRKMWRRVTRYVILFMDDEWSRICFSVGIANV